MTKFLRYRVRDFTMLLLGAFAMVGVAHAHRDGESYVYVNVTEEGMTGKLQITLDDLSLAMGFGETQGAGLTEETFAANVDSIRDYLEPRLAFYRDDEKFPVVLGDYEIFGPDGEKWVSFDFDVPELGAPPEELEADYRFLFDDKKPSHRGLLIIESNTRAGIEENESQHSVIFKPGRERQSFRVDGIPKTHVFGRFVGEGVYHIVPIGYDHILFLISLLLPAVMILQSGAYMPAPSFREPFWHVVKIVSFFTVAHTVTLTLATLNIVELPARLVESVIALSIAIVALNNIIPFMHGRLWTIVFTLGLFHGLGFANVLDPFTYRKMALAPALAGFNVGVEIGQLMVVGSVFPVLYLLRTQPFYKPVILVGGSIALMAVALFWFVQRAVFGG